MEKRRSRDLLVGAALWLAGCDEIFGVDFSDAQLREGGGGAGAGGAGGAGTGGSGPGCASGFPDSTPFCVSVSGLEQDCADAPACAGHWVDAGTSERFQLIGTDVLDTATGLTWSGQLLVDMNPDEKGCPRGFETPSRIELLSIVDYGRINPAVDDGVFLGQRGVFMAGPATAEGAWQFDFETGALHFGPPSYPVSRRCKKGVWDPKLVPVEGEDGVARESASGLLFRRAPIYAVGFFDAAEKCALLAPSHCGPFRVPSAKEMLLAITNEGHLDSALQGYEGGGSPRALTSSPRFGADEAAFWTVLLDTGALDPLPWSSTSDLNWGVYCVSGGTLHPP